MNINKNIKYKTLLLVHFIILAAGIIGYIIIEAGERPCDIFGCIPGSIIYGLFFLGLWIVSLFLFSIIYVLGDKQQIAEDTPKKQLKKSLLTLLIVTILFLIYLVFPYPFIFVPLGLVILHPLVKYFYPVLIILNIIFAAKQIKNYGSKFLPIVLILATLILLAWGREYLRLWNVWL